MSEMEETLMHKLKACGQHVRIYPLAKIVSPDVIEIGDYSMIDDFTFMYGGKGIRIGRYVHIASFVSIIGGGEFWLGDYADIACGARILDWNRHPQGRNEDVIRPAV